MAPARAWAREETEEGQPETTGVGSMNFCSWAAPSVVTVINVLTSGFLVPFCSDPD
ncbi:hypothetical protein CU044_2858 [Streptomyces sp. L-9-10]|nr:hypothetical protein CU044_2858 [Streptomyces sp. L-9-10]